MIRRYRGLILASLILGPALSTVLYMWAPRTYVAETVLSLNSRNLQILPADALIDPRSRDNLDLRSELDVISSRTLADRVARSLDPSDLLDASDVGLMGQLRTAVSDLVRAYWPSLFDWWRATRSSRPPAPYEETLADRILRGLKVSNDGRSYTVYIDFTAASPQMAQKVAEAYGQEYVAQQSDLHSSTAKMANQWLASKLTDLRGSLEKSENAVQTYRRTVGLVDPNGSVLRAQTLSNLNTELAAARAVTLGAEARLEIANMLREADGGIETFQDVLVSPIVQSLRKEETDVTRSIQELENMGSEKSTQLPILKLRLASIKAQIESETSRILASLQNEIKIAKKKELQLEANFTGAEQQSVSMTQASVHLDQLEREAAANKAVYESFLNRYKQTIEQENIPTPETRVLSQARVPNVPSNPRLGFYLMAGILGGALLAGFITGICYWFDDSIGTLADLEGMLGAPVVGTVPNGRRRLLLFGQRLPTRASEAALRRLAATLQMFRPTRQVQVAAFVSVEPNRAEAEFCLDLARMVAADGRSIVVVDAGTNDPTFKTRGKVGTVPHSCLVSFGEVDQAMWRDSPSGVRVLAITSLRPFENSGFDQSAWQSLLVVLRERYDVVLVYVRVSAEAVHAERYLGDVDAALLVATIATTARKAMSSAVRHLELCGIQIVGLVGLGAKQGSAGAYPVRSSELDDLPSNHGLKRRRASQLTKPAERQKPEVVGAL